MEFKDRLKSLRAEKGINTTTLAAQFGKSDTAVRMWETGRSKPDVDTLIRVAAYFNCTTDYLLGLSDFKNRDEQISISQEFESLSSSFLTIDGVDKQTILHIFKHTIGGYLEPSLPPLLKSCYATTVAKIVTILSSTTDAPHSLAAMATAYEIDEIFEDMPALEKNRLRELAEKGTAQLLNFIYLSESESVTAIRAYFSAILSHSKGYTPEATKEVTGTFSACFKEISEKTNSRKDGDANADTEE